MRRRLMLAGGLLLLAFLPGKKAAAQSGVTDRSRNGVTCASDDGHRHYCKVNTSRGVQMTKQRSGSPCIQGQTWGYDQRGIWVDRGCRADFLLSDYNNGNGGPGYNGPGFGRPGNGNGNGNGWNGPGDGGATVGGQRLTCSSDNGKKNYCNTNTSRGVRMVNQRSGSPCVQGQTWGYDRRGVWVDRGCRADFIVGGR